MTNDRVARVDLAHRRRESARRIVRGDLKAEVMSRPPNEIRICAARLRRRGLRAGLGNPSALYTAAIEDLVSYGYVVAAIDHTYDTAFTVFPGDCVVLYARQTWQTESQKPNGYVNYVKSRKHGLQIFASFWRNLRALMATRRYRLPSAVGSILNVSVHSVTRWVGWRQFKHAKWKFAFSHA